MEKCKILKEVSIGLLIVLITFPQYAEFSLHSSADQTINYKIIYSWAQKLGVELFHVGDYATRRKEVQESFKQAQVVARSGQKVVENMANDIKLMMDAKVSAVRRIMDTAENTAMNHQHEKVDNYFGYYNAKEMIEPNETVPTEPPRDIEDSGVPKIFIPPKEITLKPNPNFFNQKVNTSLSTVHVPTNVFDRADDVIHGIKWSEILDETFRNNYYTDQTLSWQFFGSSTGFMRQFPASKWKQDPVDLYDCRLRSWYIEAATSPKDIIILVDSSGSMTGGKIDIAKQVVNVILDTLGTNDFVNIFLFGEEIVPIVECFRDVLVQATLGNVRELKLGMEVIETTGIANFTAGLTRAFEILEVYRHNLVGAQCNQAIMVISDGAPYSYSDIFETYNWQNLPYMPVRVFTYLIGKEVADVKEIKYMACANQGYYVHLSDLAEVREQVLNYIPVMARPLVLGRHDHPVIWTQIYADVVDPKMTDWLWEVNECEEQKERFFAARADRDLFFSDEEQERRNRERDRKNLQQSTDSDKYHFMTTVAVPVYDRRINANLTEDVLVNEAYWVTVTRETRIANLLGVAGTDVPIRDIKKLMVPFSMGVNGYAFIVTNNGFVLTHPDFRPIFQGILKPSYNSVDMLEVELLDDDREPRNFSTIITDVRDEIVAQKPGSKWLLTKYHYDNMRRASRTARQYFWTPIRDTPFTLVVTYPEQYGVNRVIFPSQEEIHRIHVNGGDFENFFSGTKWKIHPDWLYCKDRGITHASPEAELRYFLKRMKQPGWKWPLHKIPPPPEHAAAVYCNRELMQALVADARFTEWFTKNLSSSQKDEKEREVFRQRFGVTAAFLSTHSGLTRWHELNLNASDELKPEQEFSTHNRRSVDEIWYKRAVEQHFVEPQSFVYSVPYESGDNPKDVIVTASHAVFHTEGGKAAPAAVVGFQFRHSAFYKTFQNMTSSCVDCQRTCASDGIDCFVLDNNGYIIISPNLRDIGKFFGEVRGSMMRRLVDENLYKEVVIFDYQGICFETKSGDNGSNFLRSPLMHLVNLLKWLLKKVFWYMIQSQIVSVESFRGFVDEYNGSFVLEQKGKHSDFDERAIINRTRPRQCDRQFSLYVLHDEKDKVIYQTPANGCERPFVVVPIPFSNLVFLVIDTECPADPSVIMSLMPTKIDYNQSAACFKADTPDLNRRRPVSCINKHVNESSIELCGDANSILVNSLLIFFALAVVKIL